MESDQNKEVEPGQEALLLLKQISELVGYDPETKSFFKEK